MTNFNPSYFFDTFSDFYKTSKVGSSPNRLNNRHRAIIENNKQIIFNSSILDLASHDGRWSFAALKNGASQVLGIEGRQRLVDESGRLMQRYGISHKKYSFIVGDIFEKMSEFKPKTFDVIFCLGIFYHIMNHMLLLTQIKRLKPKYLILDTATNTSNYAIISLGEDNNQFEANAIQTNSNPRSVIGIPSKKALELMLTNLGFEIQYYDWNKAEISNWTDIEDYRDGKRVSLLAKLV